MDLEEMKKQVDLYKYLDNNYYICNNKDCLCEEIHLDSIFQQ